MCRLGSRVILEVSVFNVAFGRKSPTAYCVDIDPHKPCMYEWLSKSPSAGPYVHIMRCGSTTLKSAVGEMQRWVRTDCLAVLYAQRTVKSDSSREGAQEQRQERPAGSV